MKSNQILIGPSGVGKTSKCKTTAKRQGKEYLDFDNDVIEKITQQQAIDIYNYIPGEKNFNPYQLINNSVENILNFTGSNNFELLEEYLTLNLDLENTVLATSGSQILSRKSMEHLSIKGTKIYLKDKLSNIIKRGSNSMKLKRIVGMPSNVDDMSKDEISKKYIEIMEERLELYEEHSDVTYVNNKTNENRENSIRKNKNGIAFLIKGKKQLNYRKDKKLNMDHFFNFLSKQGIVKS